VTNGNNRANRWGQRARNRDALCRLWGDLKTAAKLKLARDAEELFVLDRARRSLATVLELPEVCIYVVQPGGAADALVDPKIQETFDLGQPIVFAFMRRADTLELRDYGRRAKLAITPAAGSA
jgi:hypothetical protein